jgi:hypothetical protein
MAAHVPIVNLFVVKDLKQKDAWTTVETAPLIAKELKDLAIKGVRMDGSMSQERLGTAVKLELLERRFLEVRDLL